MSTDKRRRARMGTAKHHRCVNTRLKHVHGMIAEVMWILHQLKVEIEEKETEHVVVLPKV